MLISELVFSLLTCAEPQVAENGVGISQLHQILLHCLALLRPCTSQLHATVAAFAHAQHMPNKLSEKRTIRQSKATQRHQSRKILFFFFFHKIKLKTVKKI
jgi:hypothetical protein